VELRQAPGLLSDAVRERLGRLVRERQALREGEASAFVLEQNRLAIVQAQLDLARALLWEHSEAVVG
jgi:hypothetical protein